MESSSVRDKVPKREAAHFCHGKGRTEGRSWRKTMENARGIRPSALTSALRGSCCFCCRGLLHFWAADTVSLTFISFLGRTSTGFAHSHFSFSHCLGTTMTPEPGAPTHFFLTEAKNQYLSLATQGQSSIFQCSCWVYCTLTCLWATANPKYFLQIWVWKVLRSINGAIILK